jgi:hypothetical protein
LIQASDGLPWMKAADSEEMIAMRARCAAILIEVKVMFYPCFTNLHKVVNISHIAGTELFLTLDNMNRMLSEL